MAEAMALYYPFIHFQDESWLKVAALYWSRIGRIVPPDYALHDSEVVRRLQGHLGLIHDVSPIDASFHVGMLFGEFLADNEHLLRKRYGIDKADRWRADPTTMRRMGLTNERDPAAKLAHIYAPKIHPVLLERLTEAG